MRFSHNGIRQPVLSSWSKRTRSRCSAYQKITLFPSGTSTTNHVSSSRSKPGILLHETNTACQATRSGNNSGPNSPNTKRPERSFFYTCWCGASTEQILHESQMDWPVRNTLIAFPSGSTFANTMKSRRRRSAHPSFPYT